MPTPTVLLVHGAWHGAWCFGHLQEELAARGCRSLAIDLPGNGTRAALPSSFGGADPAAFAAEASPVAGTTLGEQADAVVAVLQRLADAGETHVWLAAHSMGGHVATRVGEQAPELLAGMVYVTGFMPAPGVSAVSYIQSAENAGEEVGPLLRADPEQVGALRINPRDPADRDAIVSAFAGTVAPAQQDAVLNLLTPDLPAQVPLQATDTTAARWGSLPRTYVRCTADNAIKPALQDRMIAEADALAPDNATTVVDMATCHSPFLADPSGLADILVETVG